MIRYSRWSRAVVGDGFGLIEKAVIDQHFTERARHTRLLGVLEEHPDLIGLGVDEGTALLIEGNRLQALGSGRVTVCLKKPDDGATAIHLLKPGDTAEVAVAHNESGVVRDLLRQ
jgi:cyanophycinase